MMAKVTQFLVHGKKENAYEVTTFSNDIVAGTWTKETGKSTPCTAVYTDKLQGPIVGVFGKQNTALAACLSADSDTGEGRLQLLAANGNCLHLTGSQLRRLLKLIEE